MTLINFGIALVIFLVLKPWRFFCLPDDEREDEDESDFVFRHEAVLEPRDASFTYDGKFIID
jgi:hypothetical protein